MNLKHLNQENHLANICHQIPESPAELSNHLNKHGHIIIRTNKPINEEQIIELIGGHENLMSYNEYGIQEREQISGSKFVNVTLWRKDLELPPHNELTHHTEFPQSPDIIINNAGIVHELLPLWEITGEVFGRVIDINIKGVANVIRHFVPSMVE